MVVSQSVMTHPHIFRFLLLSLLLCFVELQYHQVAGEFACNSDVLSSMYCCGFYVDSTPFLVHRARVNSIPFPSKSIVYWLADLIALSKLNWLKTSEDSVIGRIFLTFLNKLPYHFVGFCVPDIFHFLLDISN